MSTTTATPTRARRSMSNAYKGEPATEPAPAATTVAETPEPTPPAQGTRRPFGERRLRLENTPIPGFQCYWFNDLPGRIDQAKEAGYTHVTDSNGAPVVKVAGVMEGGGGLKAYRMKIPIEFYLEDQAAKEAPRAEIDAQMRQGGKDSGYSQQGRPGYTEAKVAMRMDKQGRQTSGIPPSE